MSVYKRVCCLVLFGAFTLSGCGASVVEPDDDGAGGAGFSANGGASDGAGPSDGGGGDGEAGAPPTPRNIELALEVLSSDVELDDYLVLVNDVQGALKASFSGSDLPVQVQVVDGDFVSFFQPEEALIQSYRVTPIVYRVAGTAGFDVGDGLCDVEPMSVTVTFPEVEGAYDYTLMTDKHAFALTMEASEQTVEVMSCDDNFDLLAYARGGSGEGIVGYELIRDVPFVPGGALALPLSLSSTERRPITFEIGPLDGIEELHCTADWRNPPSMFPHESGQNLSLVAPRGFVTYAPALIYPADGYGEPTIDVRASFYPEEGSPLCESSALLLRSWTDETLTFDPRHLAGVRPEDGSNRWFFSDDGALGDVVGRSWSYDEEWYWGIAEDPTVAPYEAVFPQLPEGYTWSNAAARPGMVHAGYSQYDGYADYVAGGDLTVENDVEARTVNLCQ